MIRKLFILIGCLPGFFGIARIQAQAPTPDFSANPLSGCGPLTVTFKDLSGGGPLFWAWDFGNGQISSVQNPSTVYYTPGTYTVTLIVRNTNGSNSIRKTDYITVYPYPAVSFNANLTLACAPVNIQFTDNSTPGQGSITQQIWNFGDGTTSNQPNPSHAYTATGYYSVGLTVTNSGGCTNAALLNRYIRVVPGVQTNFSWTQTSNSCSAPFAINFINQTAGPGNLSYAWNLGNGVTSNATDPATTYPSNTSYTVSLTAQSDLGCSQTTQQVISFPPANPVITSPDSACTNSPVNFANGSTPTPSASLWDFGDGTGSNSPGPSKSYPAAATYTVKLVNTYASCADSITKAVVIVNNPVANFTASTTTTGCQAPFTVTFKDQTTPGASAWLWNFGDGNTSTLQNPSHTYTSTGSFDVTLTATSSVGCSNTITKPQFVQIIPPSMTLDGSTVQGCINAAIHPVAVVNAVDGVASYAWSAPGATPATSTSPTPAFTYTAQGSYSITLTITTNGGCTLTQTFTNAITAGTPTAAAFTYTPSTICGRNQVTFTSSSLPADHWAWNFGDGTTGINTPVFHSFSKPGNFTVQLIVTNNGCPQTTSLAIQVNPPIANFGYTVNCPNNLSVSFHDSSILDNTQPASYTWDFGDGTSTTINTSPFIPPTHIYPTIGSYNVTLTVTNGSCTDVPFKRTIILGSITASFSSPATACKNQDFNLTSTSTATDPSLIASYAWQVGTGPYVTGGPIYTTNLPSNGNYQLNLLITDINGCPYPSATGSIQITGPHAQFNLPATGGGCVNSPVTFTDVSTPYPAGASITTWRWDFGDGTTVSGPSPISHIYTDTGFYVVKEAVIDNAGCLGLYSSPTPVQITAPQAFFSGPDSFYCPNVPLTFSDSSQGYGLTDNWSFGDGSPASASPTHTYPPASGQLYTVSLTVTDQVGCSSTLTRTNYVHIQAPIPAFTMQDSTSICTPLETMFTPHAQYYDSLYWDFGDGSTSTLPNTSHFYNTYDTFKVSLVLQGPGECLDSVTQRVLVLNPNTTTTFSYSPLKACDSILTDFTVVPPGYTRFTLTFGDGQADSSERTSLSHEYRSPSTYTPLLTLQDSTGCIVNISGSSGSVTILGAVPFFSVDHHAFCDSGTVNFTDFTITNDPIVSETWNFGDGSPTTTVPNPTHTYTTPGDHAATLLVTTQSNCAENYTDTIKVFQTPHPLITLSYPQCINTPIQFQGGLVTPEVDTVDWSWHFGDGQMSAIQAPLVEYSQPGQYTVSLRAFLSFGCNDSTTQTIDIHPLPSIKGPAEITTPVGFPVTIPYNYSTNTVNYSWTPPTGLSCTDCANPIASPTFTTLYTVTATDSNGCISTDSILIKTVCNDKNYFLPNTFSPNGDGVNDVFYPRGSNLYNIQSMRIFNRWGQLVFEKRDFPANTASEGWDGTFNGRPAPSDAYVYIVEVICNNAQIVALRGDVTLIR